MCEVRVQLSCDKKNQLKSVLLCALKYVCIVPVFNSNEDTIIYIYIYFMKIIPLKTKLIFV